MASSPCFKAASVLLDYSTFQGKHKKGQSFGIEELSKIKCVKREA
jgi:hypothetical protein